MLGVSTLRVRTVTTFYQRISFGTDNSMFCVVTVTTPISESTGICERGCDGRHGWHVILSQEFQKSRSEKLNDTSGFRRWFCRPSILHSRVSDSTFSLENFSDGPRDSMSSSGWMVPQGTRYLLPYCPWGRYRGPWSSHSTVLTTHLVPDE